MMTRVGDRSLSGANYKLISKGSLVAYEVEGGSFVNRLRIGDRLPSGMDFWKHETKVTFHPVGADLAMCR